MSRVTDSPWNGIAMNENIVEITYDNAQQYLIDESSRRPVVIDFWADW